MGGNTPPGGNAGKIFDFSKGGQEGFLETRRCVSFKSLPYLPPPTDTPSFATPPVCTPQTFLSPPPTDTPSSVTPPIRVPHTFLFSPSKTLPSSVTPHLRAPPTYLSLQFLLCFLPKPSFPPPTPNSHNTYLHIHNNTHTNTRAGFPTTVVWSGTSRITTAPAPIITSWPT